MQSLALGMPEECHGLLRSFPNCGSCVRWFACDRGVIGLFPCLRISLPPTSYLIASHSVADDGACNDDDGSSAIIPGKAVASLWDVDKDVRRWLCR
jgi:hypothetical protein